MIKHNLPMLLTIPKVGFYLPNRGWIWTNHSSYPYFYDAEDKIGCTFSRVKRNKDSTDTDEELVNHRVTLENLHPPLHQRLPRRHVRRINLELEEIEGEDRWHPSVVEARYKTYRDAKMELAMTMARVMAEEYPTSWSG